jgi:transcriptional regulator CtsR
MTEDYEAALITAMARRLIAGANEDEVTDVTWRLMETACAARKDAALIALAMAVSLFSERAATKNMTRERIVGLVMDLVKRMV